MSASNSYGSVEEGKVDRPFDVTETYYLKESNLSPGERRGKCLATLVPILAACLIMGGAAYFLAKDFGHLYPSHGGDPRQYDPPGNYHGNPVSDSASVPAPPHPKPTAPKPHSTATKTSSAGSSCADNEKCDKLGLKGQCCPTGSGDFLTCCN
jgi:hypothetical protein